MVARMNIKLINQKMVANNVPSDVRSAVIKEVQDLQKVAWLTPQIVVKVSDVKNAVDKALKLFELYTIKPDFLELDNITNWQSAADIESGKAWSDKKAEAAERVARIAETKARETSRNMIGTEVSDAIEVTVREIAFKIADGVAETAARISGSAIDTSTLKQISKIAAGTAHSDITYHLTWILDSDLIKGKLAENRFEPLVDLWKLGLWPIGVAKIGGIAKFWIGLPPSTDQRLPRLV